MTINWNNLKSLFTINFIRFYKNSYFKLIINFQTSLSCTYHFHPLKVYLKVHINLSFTYTFVYLWKTKISCIQIFSCHSGNVYRDDESLKYIYFAFTLCAHCFRKSIFCCRICSNVFYLPFCKHKQSTFRSKLYRVCVPSKLLLCLNYEIKYIRSCVLRLIVNNGPKNAFVLDGNSVNEFGVRVLL